MLTILRPERLVSKLSLSKHISTTCIFRTSSENSDDDSKSRKKAAASKLQDLLGKLAAESAVEKERVKVAHPVKRVIEKRPVYRIKMEKIRDRHTAKLVAAVKDVADEIGGPDVKATESELLHVILNNKRPEEKDVADLKLENVISGMQVEKPETRADQVRRAMPAEHRSRPPFKRTPSFNKTPGTLKLFEQKPLGIFGPDFKGEPASYKLPVWSKMADKELKLQVTHPPANIYEEMIRWTERGQLWTFPIDNEQGMEDEKNIDFTEHVFLDEHLEPWCPSKGPVRNFMELILVGLSKNPYITVKAKIEHIHWYRDYFESKKKVLLEVGALPAASSSESKEISA